MTSTVPPSLSIDDALQQAIVYHEAGRFSEAEQLYRAILQVLPNQPVANHNLGVLALQVGQPSASLPFLRTAVIVDPAQGQYALSYAEALLATGHAKDALEIAQAAIQCGFDSPDARSIMQQAEAAVRGGEGAEATSPEMAGPDKAIEKTSGKTGKPASTGSTGKAPAKMSRAKKSLPQAERNQLAALLSAGRLAELEDRALRLVRHYPGSGFAWKALWASLQLQGKETLHALQRAMELLPDDVEVQSNYGNALRGLGRLDEAVASYRRALKINPAYAEAHGNLGCALSDLGRLDDAVASYRRALAIQPDFVEAHNNLGNALRSLGLLDEAVASYRRALAIRPDFVDLHISLGNTLVGLGRPDEAAESYRCALAIRPECAEARNNLGCVLQDLGRFDEAVASYRRALVIRPDYAVAHSGLGNALLALGQLDETVASCRRALEIDPGCVEAHINLGNALRGLGQLETAAASYRRALEWKPDHAETHSNLGGVLKELAQFDEAVASYRRALEIKPDFAEAHSNLLFCLSHSESVDAPALFEEHRRFAAQFEAPLRPGWQPHANPRNADRCLQVGFVSGDLRNHALACFLEPVLAHLADSTNVSLHAYSNHAVEDEVTQRLKAYLTHWHPIAGLPDEALAQKIREDGIDILIDLSGHTARHRLLCFARKPAPVQASWMGYPGTTGLCAMDYYLADRFFLPPGRFDDQFTEKIVQMPASAPFLPYEAAPPVKALPAPGKGYVTFGSFNATSKLSHGVVALWATLLRALPDSRMLLGGMPEEGSYGALVEWFAQEGISGDRLDFRRRCGMEAYLGLHHEVDICLDTFPYNGGTTTLHALWMGVPTLTLAGSTPASRSGASILGHAGLEAFIAHDKAEFVEKGVRWAGRLAELAEIRNGLRERCRQSLAGQPEVVAEALERALRIMWQRWCAGLPAESFEVLRQSSGKAMPKVAR